MNKQAYCNYCRQEIWDKQIGMQETDHSGNTWSYCKKCTKERMETLKK